MTLRVPVQLLATLALAAVAICTTTAAAQSGGRYPVSNAGYGAPTGPNPGSPVAQAYSMQGQMVDAHGDAAVIPAQYCPPGYGYGNESMNAFGGVGYAVDQVGPHYFDISMEWIALQRSEVFSGNTIFTTQGFVANIDLPGAERDVVLSSSDISGDIKSGFRITGRYDVGPLSVLEIGYSGIFDVTSEASFTDTTADPVTGLGNLFSPFTNFGEGFGDPALTDPLEGGFDEDDLADFSETDRASTHTIGYASDLQSAELSYRRYWVGYSPRVTGTLLAGFRYTKLKEAFRFDSIGTTFAEGSIAPPDDPNVPDGIGTAAYRIAGDNDLAGFQAGGDMWIGIIQGLRFGTEGKVGLYNNHYTLRTSFTTSDGTPSFSEFYRDDQIAFLGEGKVMLVADVLPSVSIKGGYEVLYMTSLALVGDNFNSGSPYTNLNAPSRVSAVEDQGDALYHGWHLGFEYIW